MRYFFLVMIMVICPWMTALGEPVIFFTDLTSGPNTGGENDEGVFITVFGRGFGRERGESVVTVGGGCASRYLHWSDSKIVFQPGRQARSGFIVVHTPEGESAGSGFRVRPGRIFFVSPSTPADRGNGTFARPWKTPAYFYRAMRPGDTCYIREGVYRGKYGNRSAHANVGFGAEAPNAVSGREIVWAGYPGERARFEALEEDLDGCFEWRAPKDHYVITGLSLNGAARGCVSVSGRYNRIINNDCEGTGDFAYALVFLADNAFCDVFGNRLYGMTSRNKLSHPLYIGRRGLDIDIGWNSIYGNDVAQGPLILVNQDDAERQRLKFRNIRIHDNRIEGATKGDARPRGIGLADQARGSTAFVYNNLILDCSTAFYAISGSARFLNNTVYGCSGPAAVHIYSHSGYSPQEILVMNNILDVKNGCAYVRIEGQANAGLDFNCYHGNGPGPEEDTHAVEADPQFVSPGKDFRLKSGSPLIGMGSLDALTFVAVDYEGVKRPQGGRVTIGAFEYKQRTGAGAKGPGGS